MEGLLGSQRQDKDKKGVGFNEYSVIPEYSAMPPPPAQVYSPPKKDMSWMGLPEFVDDTVTDYSRPTCHTPKLGLDGIRVRGRDVITIRSQS
ncbi:hypothetical protein Tco_0837835, partial [Tanacetum coccineum]